MKKLLTIFILISVAVSAGAGIFDMKAGGAESPVSGSASANGAQNAAPSLEKCEKPFGTIAVVEPQDAITQALQAVKLPAPTQLLRMMIQQSNCFQVVERGMAMKNLQQERQLSAGGQLQEGSNIGGSQMIAADFLLTPTVQFSQQTGGAGLGAIGSLFGPLGAIAGAVAGGVKNQQASTSLIISDARSSLQLAAAEGSVEKADWAIGGVLGGGFGGAYASTPEGKMVAAALLDNYNNVIKSIRSLPSLTESKATPASSANAAAAPKANAFIKGDVLHAKINGIQIYQKSSDDSKVITSIGKSDDILYSGTSENGFLKVKTEKGQGWVEEDSVKK